MADDKPFGIDVSHWQDTIDWHSLRNAGVHYSFAKATDMQFPDHTPGKFIDGQFKNNYAGAKSIGAYSGAFHFAREGYSGKEQAEFFLSIYKPQPGDLLPTIDVEIEPEDPAGFVAIVRDIVAEVSKAIGGKQPIIYTQKSKWEAIDNPKGFEKCPLWVIDINAADKPDLPKSWSDHVFWQYKIDQKFHGINGVDFNYFNGPAVDIGKYCV